MFLANCKCSHNMTPFQLFCLTEKRRFFFLSFLKKDSVIFISIKRWHTCWWGKAKSPQAVAQNWKVLFRKKEAKHFYLFVILKISIFNLFPLQNKILFHLKKLLLLVLLKSSLYILSFGILVRVGEHSLPSVWLSSRNKIL